MFGENSIHDPEAKVAISTDHRGDIVCKLLYVQKGGSVFGNVMADEVRIAGRIDGIIHARKFMTAAGSKVFGAVIYEDISVAFGSEINAQTSKLIPTALFHAKDLARLVSETLPGECGDLDPEASSAIDAAFERAVENATKADSQKSVPAAITDKDDFVAPVKSQPVTAPAPVRRSLPSLF